MALQLVICGMHRSGTSLVTSVLREAGLDIGLKGDVVPEPGQPRGHFEDRDFHGLHEAILAAAGHTCFTADEAAIAVVPPVFEERARALVAARAGLPFWGWKDPRTCLFLDLWDGLLPRARYLFLYRHPVDVALSLWRRNTEVELREDPWLAFRAWELYNRRLLALRDRYPERCFVAHAPALAADLPGFVRRVAAKLALPLQDGDFHALYDAEELAPSCQPPRPAWETLILEALALYGRLEEVADLPSAEELPVTGRQRGVLQGSEILLYTFLDILQRERAGRAELARELAHLHLQEEDLRLRLEAASEKARVLGEIERSRSYTLIQTWWSIRKRWLGVADP